jgi:tRNA1Val (adenine37-N6)-methyltransferase
MFRFKQFTVNQTGCAMKINTDGVLLGAIAEVKDPASILDIGTGTGVIALMLAQEYTEANVDAVEVDADAAQTAARNFKGSPFADRLRLFPIDFETYFKQSPVAEYDLIVSNPPFYTASLKSPEEKKNVAKHAGMDFFERLMECVSGHLSPKGLFWMILPVNISETVVRLASTQNLCLQMQVNIKSFAHSEPHRVILCFGFEEVFPDPSDWSIYATPGIYSGAYQKLLQPYFIAF